VISASNLYRKLVQTAPWQPATNYWRAVELDAVQKHGLPEGRGLDLGCGDGKLTQILNEALTHSANRRWVGIDPDPDETVLAQETGIYEQVHTVAGSDIPEVDASFDFAFSNSVLEHIPDIEPVIAEVSRLLRSDGKFIFTVPCNFFHDCLAGPILGKKSEDYLKALDTRCAHVRYWSLQQWNECLNRYDLKIISSLSYLSLYQVRRWEKLSNITGGLLYKLHGSQRRPIEIQRRLKMRRKSLNLLDRLAASSSTIALIGASPDAQDSSTRLYGCLLIEARKKLRCCLTYVKE